MHLPERQALGRRRGSGRVEPIADGALAVAAVLPVGYLRLLFPAYAAHKAAVPATLPLYGYAAVAELDGGVVVAASRSDAFSPWTGRRPSDARLRVAVAQAQRQLARSRVIAQLSVCALQHNCLTAQNTFLRRFEGALPTSAACNADCLGCISLQTDSGAPTPQPRIPRAPTAEDLIEVGSYHLDGAGTQGDGGMLSFGQGCEGEPLLRERALRPVALELRRAVPRIDDSHQHQRQPTEGAAPSDRRRGQQLPDQRLQLPPRPLRGLLPPPGLLHRRCARVRPGSPAWGSAADRQSADVSRGVRLSRRGRAVASRSARAGGGSVAAPQPQR